MKRFAAAFLAMMLLLTGTAACGQGRVEPTVPETKPLPGILRAVSYARGGGSLARYDFEIRLNPEEIEYARFWPMDSWDTEPDEIQNLPIGPEQWADVERAVLSMYQTLEECVPAQDEQNPLEVFVLDGGEYDEFSLTWESNGEIIQKDYIWPADRHALTLSTILQELVDPCGREIVWVEEAVPKGIYIAREYTLNHKKDYSFQIRRNDYDPAEQPCWELLYYLGRHGAVASGSIPLEDDDWTAFLELVRSAKLEYFPQPEESDEHFRCTLYYSDGGYKNLVLNKETEELLRDFFNELIQ